MKERHFHWWKMRYERKDTKLNLANISLDDIDHAKLCVSSSRCVYSTTNNRPNYVEFRNEMTLLEIRNECHQQSSVLKRCQEPKEKGENIKKGHGRICRLRNQIKKLVKSFARSKQLKEEIIVIQPMDKTEGCKMYSTYETTTNVVCKLKTDKEEDDVKQHLDTSSIGQHLEQDFYKVENNVNCQNISQGTHETRPKKYLPATKTLSKGIQEEQHDLLTADQPLSNLSVLSKENNSCTTDQKQSAEEYESQSLHFEGEHISQIPSVSLCISSSMDNRYLNTMGMDDPDEETMIQNNIDSEFLYHSGKAGYNISGKTCVLNEEVSNDQPLSANLMQMCKTAQANPGNNLLSSPTLQTRAESQPSSGALTSAPPQNQTTSIYDRYGIRHGDSNCSMGGTSRNKNKYCTEQTSDGSLRYGSWKPDSEEATRNKTEGTRSSGRDGISNEKSRNLNQSCTRSFSENSERKMKTQTKSDENNREHSSVDTEMQQECSEVKATNGKTNPSYSRTSNFELVSSENKGRVKGEGDHIHECTSEYIVVSKTESERETSGQIYSDVDIDSTNKGNYSKDNDNGEKLADTLDFCHGRLPNNNRQIPSVPNDSSTLGMQPKKHDAGGQNTHGKLHQKNSSSGGFPSCSRVNRHSDHEEEWTTDYDIIDEGDYVGNNHKQRYSGTDNTSENRLCSKAGDVEFSDLFFEHSRCDSGGGAKNENKATSCSCSAVRLIKEARYHKQSDGTSYSSSIIKIKKQSNLNGSNPTRTRNDSATSGMLSESTDWHNIRGRKHPIYTPCDSFGSGIDRQYSSESNGISEIEGQEMMRNNSSEGNNEYYRTSGNKKHHSNDNDNDRDRGSRQSSNDGSRETYTAVHPEDSSPDKTFESFNKVERRRFSDSHENRRAIDHSTIYEREEPFDTGVRPRHAGSSENISNDDDRDETDGSVNTRLQQSSVRVQDYHLCERSPTDEINDPDQQNAVCNPGESSHINIPPSIPESTHYIDQSACNDSISLEIQPKEYDAGGKTTYSKMHQRNTSSHGFPSCSAKHRHSDDGKDHKDEWTNDYGKIDEREYAGKASKQRHSSTDNKYENKHCSKAGDLELSCQRSGHARSDSGGGAKYKNKGTSCSGSEVRGIEGQEMMGNNSSEGNNEYDRISGNKKHHSNDNDNDRDRGSRQSSNDGSRGTYTAVHPEDSSPDNRFESFNKAHRRRFSDSHENGRAIDYSTIDKSEVLFDPGIRPRHAGSSENINNDDDRDETDGSVNTKLQQTSFRVKDYHLSKRRPTDEINDPDQQNAVCNPGESSHINIPPSIPDRYENKHCSKAGDLELSCQRSGHARSDSGGGAKNKNKATSCSGSEVRGIEGQEMMGNNSSEGNNEYDRISGNKKHHSNDNDNDRDRGSRQSSNDGSRGTYTAVHPEDSSPDNRFESFNKAHRRRFSDSHENRRAIDYSTIDKSEVLFDPGIRPRHAGSSENINNDDDRDETDGSVNTKLQQTSFRVKDYHLSERRPTDEINDPDQQNAVCNPGESSHINIPPSIPDKYENKHCSKAGDLELSCQRSGHARSDSGGGAKNKNKATSCSGSEVRGIEGQEMMGNNSSEGNNEYDRISGNKKHHSNDNDNDRDRGSRQSSNDGSRGTYTAVHPEDSSPDNRFESFNKAHRRRFSDSHENRRAIDYSTIDKSEVLFDPGIRPRHAGSSENINNDDDRDETDGSVNTKLQQTSFRVKDYHLSKRRPTDEINDPDQHNAVCNPGESSHINIPPSIPDKYENKHCSKAGDLELSCQRSGHARSDSGGGAKNKNKATSCSGSEVRGIEGQEMMGNNSSEGNNEYDRISGNKKHHSNDNDNDSDRGSRQSSNGGRRGTYTAVHPEDNSSDNRFESFNKAHRQHFSDSHENGRAIDHSTIDKREVPFDPGIRPRHAVSEQCDGSVNTRHQQSSVRVQDYHLCERSPTDEINDPDQQNAVCNPGESSHINIPPSIPESTPYIDQSACNDSISSEIQPKEYDAGGKSTYSKMHQRNTSSHGFPSCSAKHRHSDGGKDHKDKWTNDYGKIDEREYAGKAPKLRHSATDIKYENKHCSKAGDLELSCQRSGHARSDSGGGAKNKNKGTTCSGSEVRGIEGQEMMGNNSSEGNNEYDRISGNKKHHSNDNDSDSDRGSRQSSNGGRRGTYTAVHPEDNSSDNRFESFNKAHRQHFSDSHENGRAIDHSTNDKREVPFDPGIRPRHAVSEQCDGSVNTRHQQSSVRVQDYHLCERSPTDEINDPDQQNAVCNPGESSHINIPPSIPESTPYIDQSACNDSISLEIQPKEYDAGGKSTYSKMHQRNTSSHGFPSCSAKHRHSDGGKDHKDEWTNDYGKIDEGEYAGKAPKLRHSATDIKYENKHCSKAGDLELSCQRSGHARSDSGGGAKYKNKGTTCSGSEVRGIEGQEMMGNNSSEGNNEYDRISGNKKHHSNDNDNDRDRGSRQSSNDGSRGTYTAVHPEDSSPDNRFESFNKAHRQHFSDSHENGRAIDDSTIYEREVPFDPGVRPRHAGSSSNINNDDDDRDVTDGSVNTRYQQPSFRVQGHHFSETSLKNLRKSLGSEPLSICEMQTFLDFFPIFEGCKVFSNFDSPRPFPILPVSNMGVFVVFEDARSCGRSGLGHFIAVQVNGKKGNEMHVTIYDHLKRNEINKHTKDLIMKILYLPAGSLLTVHMFPVQSQVGNKDCGPLALHDLVYLRLGEEDKLRHRFDQSEIRSHLQYCVDKRKCTCLPPIYSEPDTADTEVMFSFSVK